MSFSFKVAPGVRVRASSRGVRTSIGPRAARVHVGAGRTGFSTGAGPVTFYTRAVGAPRTSRPNTLSTYQRQQAAYARQQAKEQKAQQARDLAATFERILNLHRAQFPAAQPLVAPAASSVDTATIHSRHQAAALAGISILKRSDRKAAREAASVGAEEEIAQLTSEAAAAQAATQRNLDDAWARLVANDPDHVLEALEAAFEDNDAAAAPVAVSGGEAALVVLAPRADAVPERIPRLTDAGNLSLKKLSKSDRAGFYKLMVCGHLLATVRETFAVAPGISTVRVVVIRLSELDSYGRSHEEPLLAASFDRSALDGIRWRDADAGRVVSDAATELRMKEKGAAKELVPLDISDEPDLSAVLRAVDIEELAR